MRDMQLGDKQLVKAALEFKENLLPQKSNILLQILSAICWRLCQGFK